MGYSISFIFVKMTNYTSTKASNLVFKSTINFAIPEVYALKRPPEPDGRPDNRTLELPFAV